jgi:signal transduction histidine kinase
MGDRKPLKNSLDAMQGRGAITTTITDAVEFVYVDIHDTGKGYSQISHQNCFQPGYTTKNRGWGLGLSLSKRIIEEYHDGQIFVKNSEINKGTTFRIVLKKQIA